MCCSCLGLSFSEPHWKCRKGGGGGGNSAIPTGWEVLQGDSDWLEECEQGLPLSLCLRLKTQTVQSGLTDPVSPNSVLFCSREQLWLGTMQLWLEQSTLQVPAKFNTAVWIPHSADCKTGRLEILQEKTNKKQPSFPPCVLEQNQEVKKPAQFMLQRVEKQSWQPRRSGGKSGGNTLNGKVKAGVYSWRRKVSFNLAECREERNVKAEDKERRADEGVDG